MEIMAQEGMRDVILVIFSIWFVPILTVI